MTNAQEAGESSNLFQCFHVFDRVRRIDRPQFALVHFEFPGKRLMSVAVRATSPRSTPASFRAVGTPVVVTAAALVYHSRKPKSFGDSVPGRGMYADRRSP